MLHDVGFGKKFAVGLCEIDDTGLGLCVPFGQYWQLRFARLGCLASVFLGPSRPNGLQSALFVRLMLEANSHNLCRFLHKTLQRVTHAVSHPISEM